jgi:uncharacterized protein
VRGEGGDASSIFAGREAYVYKCQIAQRGVRRHVCIMRAEVFGFILAVFVLAGFVKGVIGLGLPTISMGLLALVMPPVEAAAILVLPSLLTNVWQMLSGPALKPSLKRLWPMMLAICAGTWASAGLMTGADAPYMTGLLGIALLLYALSGFTPFDVRVPARQEPWLGPAMGAMTGIVTGATGVFVIPAVPYLQAIGLAKDELIQALGLAFTVSTLALAANVFRADAVNVFTLSISLGALVAALGGMWLGQALRSRLQPLVFRRCFFAGLLLLGLYLAVGAFY